MESRTEYVVRDGELRVRAISEESLGDQGAFLLSLLGEGYFTTMAPGRVDSCLGRLEAAFVHNSKKGTTEFLLVNLGNRITVESFMLTSHTDGSITPCPWRSTELLGHKTGLTSAFRTTLHFPSPLILGIPFTQNIHDTQIGIVNKTQMRLFMRTEGTFFPAPLPHVNSGANFCINEPDAVTRNKFALNPYAAAGAIIDECLVRSQWRGHWTENFGRSFQPNVRILDDGSAEIVYGAPGRAKCPPAWWCDNMKAIP